MMQTQLQWYKSYIVINACHFLFKIRLLPKEAESREMCANRVFSIPAAIRTDPVD